MDEKVESVKILTDKPMLNGSLTLFLECVSNDPKYWRSPELFVHPHKLDTFRYRYVVKHKEGLAAWLLKKVTLSGGKEKTVRETTTRTLKTGRHQYDIFHYPNDHKRMNTIFHGQFYFIKMLYHLLGKDFDLKEMVIECEHVGFGHPSYALTDIDSFVQWVVEVIDKTPSPSQSVYICSLVGQFAHRMRSWSACGMLEEKAADQLLFSFSCCSHKALPQSTIRFIKVVAEDLFRAGSSTGFLMFIKVFCNLLDVNYVFQVSDKLSSRAYTDQQFLKQLPGVLDSLRRLEGLDSCRRLSCYIIHHSPSVQCLWNLYHEISSRLPNLEQSLVGDFSNIYCKFISRRGARKPDLLHSSFWRQVPQKLTEKLANPFCKALTEQILSETNLPQANLDGLTAIVQDARLQSADQFSQFVLAIMTHKSEELVSIVPVLLESKTFSTYWNTRISAGDKQKVCFNWLRANWFRVGKKQNKQILGVVMACDSLCSTDALKMDKPLCQDMDKEVERMVLMAKFESIMNAYEDSQKCAPAIQQRLRMLLRSAIKHQSGSGDRQSRYRKMVHLLGYDASMERKRELRKEKLDG